MEQASKDMKHGSYMRMVYGMELMGMHEGNEGAIHKMDTYIACMEATYGTHMKHTHMERP